MYDLERFLKAQERDYAYALKEIRAGKKRSHWIWYVFPQLRGLGRSERSYYYGLDGINEAKVYYEHSLLRERLLEITQSLLELESNDPVEILGETDAIKVCSCMTLFTSIAEKNSVFEQVLEKFYGGERDKLTLQLLKNYL